MAIRATWTAWLVVVCAACSAAPAHAQEVIPGAASAWQLDFEFLDPHRITLRLPGTDEEMTYWYVLYRVTNNTGKDVQFMPSAQLVTNTLDVVTAGDNVHPTVYKKIAALHKKEYPFFARPTKVSGLLLQGEENARSSAFVFTPFDIKADSFSIHISGLSGLIDRIANPAFDSSKPESDENPRSFTRRLTLALDYVLPGDETSRRSASPIRKNRRWEMR